MDDKRAGHTMDDYVAGKLREHSESILKLQTDVSEITTKLDQNSKDTAAIKDDTASLVEWAKIWHGNMLLLQKAGKVARPLSYIVTLVGGVVGAYVAIRTGIVPK